jgi:hypothetical protein
LALTHVRGLFGLTRAQTCSPAQHLPLQHDPDEQHAPPQATVPKPPSRQHAPSMQTSSGQQQRSSAGSLVPRRQISDAGQQNSVPQ